MRTVTIEVSSIRKSLGRFRRAVKTRAAQGEFVSFENLDTLLKTLTSKRWDAAAAHCKGGNRCRSALWRASLVGTSRMFTPTFKRWSEIGLIEKAGRRIRVPFDEIRTEFVVRKAA